MCVHQSGAPCISTSIYTLRASQAEAKWGPWGCRYVSPTGTAWARGFLLVCRVLHLNKDTIEYCDFQIFIWMRRISRPESFRRGRFFATVSAASCAGESREGVNVGKRCARSRPRKDGRLSVFMSVSAVKRGAGAPRAVAGHRRPPLSNDLGAGGDGRASLLSASKVEV